MFRKACKTVGVTGFLLAAFSTGSPSASIMKLSKSQGRYPWYLCFTQRPIAASMYLPFFARDRGEEWLLTLLSQLDR